MRGIAHDLSVWSDMALVAAESTGAFMELDVGDTPMSLARLVESQRELFHSQIDQLQKLFVAQCRLTGANPLAQEMAAGALSVRIGKRPWDLLNPKAVKYMQSVFSIKDAIGKKETREISAFCGVTVSQVREFFAGQRARVRKLVRLSCEKATRSEAARTSQQECPFRVDNSPLFNKEPSRNAADAFAIGECKLVPDTTGILGTVRTDRQEMLNLIDLAKVEEGRPPLSQEETIPGVDSDDKEFLDNILSLMKKEQTFSGQVKLMEWVLHIQNSSVLNWFSNNGSVTILATWLSEAADEEQTTVLLVILKVLYHLLLHKALLLHMSAIVPAVNRLRFYRSSDISSKAGFLLLLLNSEPQKSQLAEERKNFLRNRMQLFLYCFNPKATMEDQMEGMEQLKVLTEQSEFTHFKSSILSLIEDINKCIATKGYVDATKNRLQFLKDQMEDKYKIVDVLAPQTKNHIQELRELHAQKRIVSGKVKALELKIATLQEQLQKIRFEEFTLEEVISREVSSLIEIQERLKELHESQNEIIFEHTNNRSMLDKLARELCPGVTAFSNLRIIVKILCEMVDYKFTPHEFIL